MELNNALIVFLAMEIKKVYVPSVLKNENNGNDPSNSFGVFGGNVFPAAQP